MHLWLRSKRGPIFLAGLASILLLIGVLALRNGRGKVAPSWASVQSALARQDLVAAEDGLRRILAVSPTDGQALAALGSLLAGTNRPAEAEKVLRSVPESDANWGASRSILAELALDRHNAAEAERLLIQAIERDPNAYAPRQRLVFLYNLEGRTGEARDRLWELYRLTQDPNAVVELVLSAFAAQNDTRGLLEQIEPFFKETPEDPCLRRIEGLALLQVGQAKEALPHLESSRDHFSEDPTGRFALAECLTALGEPTPSVNILGPAPSDRVNRSLWHTLRSRLQESEGKEDEARESLKEALKDHERNREAHFRLGQLLTRQGEKSAGKLHLDRAEELRQKENAARKAHEAVRTSGLARGAFESLADLCRDAGLMAEARAWLEQALRADPTRQSVQIKLAELAGKPEPFPFALVRLKPAVNRNASIAASRPLASPGVEANVAFEDAAARLGLKFTYESGAKGDLFIGDTMGGGVALIDFDRDGRLDVYFVNGCRVPFDRARPPAPNRLFRNRPDGTFEDVTEKAKVGGRGYGMGAAVADFDADGFSDLFVTGLGSTVLYRNRGDGTFEDVTARAGVSSERWTTAAGFADLDGDGDLDLVAVAYVEADPAHVFPCLDHLGKPIHCSPGRFQAQTDHLWRNNGDGTFTDVASEAGLDLPNGRGLGLAIADLDEDGRLDIFIANDASPNFYFHNQGGLKFEEMGATAGLALNGQGKATASMGVVADDLDGDGLIDLLHTNFINESCTFRRNLGKGFFADLTLAANLEAATRSKTGFGATALDANGDGRLDLFLTNGHVDDQPWIDTPMAQRPQLFLALSPGRFRMVEPKGFPFLQKPMVGRGLAMGDLNGDGGVDLVVVHRDAPAAVLLNRKPPQNWLGVRLLGTGAVGARVTCRSGKRETTRFATSGTSYLSAHDSRLWFTLAGPKVEELEVRWISGRVSRLKEIQANRVIEVSEPK